MAINGAGGEQEARVATHPSFEPLLEVAKEGLAMVENMKAKGETGFQMLVAMGRWNNNKLRGFAIPEAVVVPLEEGCEVFETVIKPYATPKAVLSRGNYEGPSKGPHVDRRPARPDEVIGGWVEMFSVERMFEVVFIGTTNMQSGALTGAKSVSRLFKLTEGASAPYTPDHFVQRAAFTLPDAPDLPGTTQV